MSGFNELIRDQADVSFGSIQPSLSSSLSESSDSDNSIATRLAKIEATSNGAAFRSISFCSDFSTLRRVIPGKINLMIFLHSNLEWQLLTISNGLHQVVAWVMEWRQHLLGCDNVRHTILLAGLLHFAIGQ